MELRTATMKDIEDTVRKKLKNLESLWGSSMAQKPSL